MCNHYRNAILKGAVIPGWSIDQFSEIKIPLRFHNQPPDVYPDREGMVVRVESGEPVVELMRWGFPHPPNVAGGRPVTNVRNTKSAFWRPWLKSEHRCLVPATSFAEYGPEAPKRERWFARRDGRPIWFAGIWRAWEGDRGPKSKPISGEHLLYSFLTCEPNAVVKPIHSKAMPVILQPDDCETWLSGTIEEALALQRPLADDELVVLDAKE